MVIIIQSGFQAVKLEIFRKASLSKGLVKSCHVSNVIEQNDGSFRRICAQTRERELLWCAKRLCLTGHAR